MMQHILKFSLYISKECKYCKWYSSKLKFSLYISKECKYCKVIKVYI